jgi:lipoyl(octanoyl) transferase
VEASQGMGQNNTADWISLGTCPYQMALDIQYERAQALLDGKDEQQTIYSVVHPPTITIGKHGNQENIVASEDELGTLGVDVFQVDRGGDVTYHGPGQWVLYPVLHLGPWKNDVGRYIHNLEETVIASLRDVGIAGQRVQGLPGVWVDNAKICAIGARLRRRSTGEFVTTHGIALNVTTNLTHFDLIVPCGIRDKSVTSVAEELRTEVDFAAWEWRLQQHFYEIFDLQGCIQNG